MKGTKDSPAMRGDEFDLYKNYHDAIECIYQCEGIIKTLQEELASKNDCIASLEGKLVRMLLELASAKSAEDEHALLKRKMSGLSALSAVSASARGGSGDCSRAQTRRNGTDEGRIGPSRTPTRPAPRAGNSRGGPKPRSAFSNSWCGTSNGTASAITDSTDPRRSQSVRGHLGVGLSRVMSWVSADVPSDEGGPNHRSKEDRGLGGPGRCESGGPPPPPTRPESPGETIGRNFSRDDESSQAEKQ